MLQENHSFDNYFGMLNPYRKANNWNIGDDGVDYKVDGIDDKLTTISNSDDEGTSFPLSKSKARALMMRAPTWLASYGDVNRYDFQPLAPDTDGWLCSHRRRICEELRGIRRNTAPATFTDLTGQRAMGYYDQDFLNYYYYMASQFAVSDRWFSPVASKSIPNRIATFTGGTTQGLVKDPGGERPSSATGYTEHLPGARSGQCLVEDLLHGHPGLCLAGNDDCTGVGNASIPATDFSNLSYSTRYRL